MLVKLPYSVEAIKILESSIEHPLSCFLNIQLSIYCGRLKFKIRVRVI